MKKLGKTAELPHATGLYEQLITEAVARHLAELEAAGQKVVRSAAGDEAWKAAVTRHVDALVKIFLEQAGAEGWEERLTRINEVVAGLQPDAAARLDGAGQVLLALGNRLPERPVTGLVGSTLFTGGNGGIQLASEIKRELRSADGVDLLVSFIKYKGLTVLRDALEDLAYRKGKIRVLTTTYMGASEAKAIDLLVESLGAEVRVSYNSQRERLHAKAYLFHRNSGFHTAYIGSSNFSHAALTTGTEWNMKMTAADAGHVLETFRATFETYWASKDFVPYEPARDRERLEAALQHGRGGPNAIGLNLTFFDLKPHPFQEEILEALTVERTVHACQRNLVIAATGTGKTMLAAFDFRRLRQEAGCRTLLFVCHREEILAQARATYAQVLKDANFGELWLGGQRPSRFEVVFASVQTLSHQLHGSGLSPDHFDVVVIDEAHHGTAASYRPIFQYFSPLYWLGLTATPEREDGGDILQDFDGRIAAEIRLPEALNRGLLCPFHYLGLSDNVDLAGVKWERGGYQRDALSKVLTGNEVRLRQVLQNLEKYTLDPAHVRALGFCVSIDHAEFMATSFQSAGLRAQALTSRTPVADRAAFREQLRMGDLAYLFVVDVFNEGVDLPEVDTVLFLRPTESATVFLQQLGRGLRLAPGKEQLTVFDFVAHSRDEYDFSHKFRSLLGRTSRSIQQELDADFPGLPLGCNITIETKAREWILESLRRAARSSRTALLRRFRAFHRDAQLPLTLPNFLAWESLPIEELYKPKGVTFTGLVAEVLQRPAPSGPVDLLSRALQSDWMVLQDVDQIRFIAHLAQAQFQWDADTATPQEHIRALMVYWDVYDDDAGFSTLPDALAALGSDASLCAEIADFMAYRADQIRTATHPLAPLAGAFPSPLCIHGVYSRRQILTGLGFNSFEKRRESREGVAYHAAHRVDALFVDLVKDPKHFSPSTLYHDYALTEELFHWQSQNRTSPTSPTGQRYIHHVAQQERILLFVREQQSNAYGGTSGYLFAGEATYIRHEGSRPMSIIWQLSHPLPGWIWRVAAKLRVG